MPRVSEGFSIRYLWIMGIMAVVGALAITLSLLFHSRIPTRVSPIELREHQPSKVLVGVRGTSTDPAFFGFLAIVNPKSQVLTVVPISGKLLVHGVPLYLATAGKSAKEDASLISSATGVPFHSYFFLTASDLTMVLNALYYHTGHWPATDTPTTMLNNLGYPYGPSHGWDTVNLLSRIVQALPSVSPIAASHLLGMTKTSVTNLTSYQLFLLANYIRGDNLQLGHMADFRSHSVRRDHG
ncbi:MAG: hypothetical protein C7B46_16270 [Sulfobacillus benefaciens]|uniref:Cell envelope-related transcriptional attenuator domain-containing protein n=1 Tax=Sulfobacillus benefaciens TaxID=453960 RepID=A0A2T2XBW4_9FIRM|nr:MAG: hypothetical protein C7B46_16270 [Sulfobacillus benefaciens]